MRIFYIYLRIFYIIERIFNFIILIYDTIFIYNFLVEEYGIMKKKDGIYRNRIRQLRIENKLTLQELAEKVKISYQNLAKYETDKVTLSTEKIKKLCEIFDVAADYLLGDSEKRTIGEPNIDERFVEVVQHAKVNDIKPVELLELLNTLINMSKKR